MSLIRDKDTLKGCFIWLLYNPNSDEKTNIRANKYEDIIRSMHQIRRDAMPHKQLVELFGFKSDNMTHYSEATKILKISDYFYKNEFTFPKPLLYLSTFKPGKNGEHPFLLVENYTEYLSASYIKELEQIYCIYVEEDFKEATSDEKMKQYSETFKTYIDNRNKSSAQ